MKFIGDNELISCKLRFGSYYSLVSLFQAELQKIRVEMAAMKRDAEHYSRQVILSHGIPTSNIL